MQLLLCRPPGDQLKHLKRLEQSHCHRYVVCTLSVPLFDPLKAHSSHHLRNFGLFFHFAFYPPSVKHGKRVPAIAKHEPVTSLPLQPFPFHTLLERIDVLQLRIARPIITRHPSCTQPLVETTPFDSIHQPHFSLRFAFRIKGTPLLTTTLQAVVDK
jgi:hypothetical protein